MQIVSLGDNLNVMSKPIFRELLWYTFALWSTLIGSTYPCLEQTSLVWKMFEPLKFDCIWKSSFLLCIC